MTSIKRVCIIGSNRTPFARSGSDYLKLGNKDLMTAALKGLINRYNLKDKVIGEVILGAVSKHTSDFSLARECTIDAGLSYETPATDIQKACGTGLEAFIMCANKISLGQIDCAIAGGTDTNSDIPVEFPKNFGDTLAKVNFSKTSLDMLKSFTSFRPKDLIPVLPAVKEPRTGLSMGESCELMAKDWDITREEQDQLTLESHQKTTLAYEEGFYNDLVSPFKSLSKDNNLRPSISLKKMAKLKPCFDKKSGKGTLTPANSTPLTDGASCVFLCSEDYAKENNLDVHAYFTMAQSAAVNYVNGEGLLMAPAYAVPKLLKKTKLTFEDIDFFEIHEAFAAQVLCTMKAWESEKFCKDKLNLESALGSIDRAKLNIKGGSLSIGHPFAATGARIIGGLAKILNDNGSGKGLISICTAGGMGVTAILEK